MKKRKNFLIGTHICIVQQEALLDSKAFLRSRLEDSTLALIGEKRSNISHDKIFDEMRHREIAGNSLPNMAWSIVTKKEEQYVGDISLFPLENSYGLNIVILSEERGKGYGTEAINLLTNYFLLHPKVDRIYAQIYANNPNAFCLFKRLGFHFCHVIDSNYRLANGSNCYAYLLYKCSE